MASVFSTFSQQQSSGGLGLADEPAEFSEAIRVVRKHARGGLGIVYLAEDKSIGREIAVKTIRDEYVGDERLREKFIREAKITGRLEHPGIVPVYRFGMNADGLPYYGMKFIRGDRLTDRIVRYHDLKSKHGGKSDLELRRLLRQLIDIGNALEYAHERGVIHRDLKPSNVMIGRYGETLVVDWGLAKLLENEEKDSFSLADNLVYNARSGDTADGGSDTLQGQFVGTISYAPPEQLRGELDQLGYTTDVYSLGAILYEILVGSAPIKRGGSIEDIIATIEQHSIPVPRALDRQVPHGLDLICRKAMRPLSSERYQRVAHMVSDIESWLDDRPLSISGEPLPVRAVRWGRRHPKMLTATTATMVLTIAGLAVGNRVVAGKNRELSLASKARAEALDVAMDSVNRFLSRQALDPRAAADGITGLQASSMQSAYDQFERLGEIFKDEPALQREKVETLRSMSLTLASLGQFEDALEKAKSASALLAAQSLGKPSFEQRLLDAQLRRAIGYYESSIGKPMVARQVQAESVSLLESLLDEDAENARTQFEMAVSQTYLGESYVLGQKFVPADFGQALEAYKTSEKWFALIPEAQRRDVGGPEDPGAYLYFRGMNLFNLALACLVTGKREAAIEHSEESVRLYERLCRDFPNDPNWTAPGFAWLKLAFLVFHIDRLDFIGVDS